MPQFFRIASLLLFVLFFGGSASTASEQGAEGNAGPEKTVPEIVDWDGDTPQVGLPYSCAVKVLLQGSPSAAATKAKLLSVLNHLQDTLAVFLSNPNHWENADSLYPFHLSLSKQLSVLSNILAGEVRAFAEGEHDSRILHNLAGMVSLAQMNFETAFDVDAARYLLMRAQRIWRSARESLRNERLEERGDAIHLVGHLRSTQTFLLNAIAYSERLYSEGASTELFTQTTLSAVYEQLEAMYFESIESALSAHERTLRVRINLPAVMNEVSNLFRNAVQAGTPKGLDPSDVWIVVSVDTLDPQESIVDERQGLKRIAFSTTRGSYLRISIQDKAGGLPDGLLPRLFEWGASTRIGEGGSGIGLNSVSREVQAHGGIIEVRSKKGEGTIFEMLLPLESAVSEPVAEVGRNPAAQTSLAASQAVSVNKELPKILIIDDARAQRFLFSRMLGKRGFATLEAETRGEAVALLANSSPSIIFCDFNTGNNETLDLDDFALACSKQGIPLVVQSGDELSVHPTGVVESLLKPTDFSKIIDSIETHWGPLPGSLKGP